MSDRQVPHTCRATSRDGGWARGGRGSRRGLLSPGPPGREAELLLGGEAGVERCRLVSRDVGRYGRRGPRPGADQVSGDGDLYKPLGCMHVERGWVAMGRDSSMEARAGSGCSQCMQRR